MSNSISAAGASSPDGAYGASSCGAVAPEEQLLALIVYAQSSQMDGAKTSVNLNAEQLEKLREQVKHALEQARDAKKDSGFWGGLAKLFGGDIASVASAVAAVAAVVATGGAAAAVLAVVAAAATLAADHAKELGIPTEVALAIAVTASVAGICCGNAKGLFDVGESVKTIATDVKIAGYVSAGVATAGGAGCGIASAKYERDAGHLNADARSAQGLEDTVSSDIDEALERFAEAVERQGNAVRLTSQIQQQSYAGNYAVLSNWGGAA